MVKKKVDTDIKGQMTDKWLNLITTGDDYNSYFNHPTTCKTVERMRVNSTIYSLMSTYESLIANLTFKVNCKDEDISVEIQRQLEGIKFGWQNFLYCVASQPLAYGFALFEKIWAVQDGKYYLADLSPRPQKTIWSINLDDEGYPISYTQTSRNSANGFVEIPVDKLLIFTNRFNGRNPYGESILRSVYKEFNYCEQIGKLLLIAHDRFAVPYPIATISNKEYNTLQSKVEKALENIRSHQSSALAIPDSVKITTLSEAGGAQNLLPSIEYFDSKIPKILLLQILNFGQNKATGSYALSDNMNDLFFKALKGYVSFICQTMNDLIKEMTINSFGEQVEYPYLVANELANEDIKYAAESLIRLVEKNIIKLSPTDIDFLRSAYGLPEQEPEQEQTETETDNKCLCHYEKKEWHTNRTHKLLDVNNVMSKMTFFEEQYFDIMIKFFDDKKTWFAQKTISADGDINKFTEYPAGYGKLRTDIRNLTDNVFDFGKSEMQTEIEKIKGVQKAPRLYITEARLKKYLNDVIDKRLDMLTMSYKADAVNAYMTANSKYIHNQIAFNDILKELVDGLEELSDKRVSGAASGMSSVSFNEGRAMVASEEDVKLYEYSAMFDKNTCEVCAKLDGQIFQYGDPNYIVPNPNCLGTEQRCRCVVIPYK